MMDIPEDQRRPYRTQSHPPVQTIGDHAAAVQRLARLMFDLQADDYGAEDTMREQAWADDGIRAFWRGQAGAVLSFLGLEACA